MNLENPTTYEVTLTEAREWVHNYQEGLTPGATKAFLIDAEELQGILSMSTNVKYVRVYFGLDPNRQEHPEKLLLVPVNIEGEDMINTEGNNSQIYDFTTPCPPTCDFNSPINSK